MSPLVADGDVLTLEPVKGAALRLGDIALYRAGADRFVCHRLLARRRAGGDIMLGFRGDALTDLLDWVGTAGVMGRAAHLKSLQRWHGWLCAWLRWTLARLRIKLGAWRRRRLPGG